MANSSIPRSIGGSIPVIFVSSSILSKSKLTSSISFLLGETETSKSSLTINGTSPPIVNAPFLLFS